MDNIHLQHYFGISDAGDNTLKSAIKDFPAKATLIRYRKSKLSPPGKLERIFLSQNKAVPENAKPHGV